MINAVSNSSLLQTECRLQSVQTTVLNKCSFNFSNSGSHLLLLLNCYILHKKQHRHYIASTVSYYLCPLTRSYLQTCCCPQVVFTQSSSHCRIWRHTQQVLGANWPRQVKLRRWIFSFMQMKTTWEAISLACDVCNWHSLEVRRKKKTRGNTSFHFTAHLTSQ